MEISQLKNKAHSLFAKYKYVAIILIAGIVLMLLPGGGKDEAPIKEQTTIHIDVTLDEVLSQMLSKVHGAGRVEVMLNVSQVEKTIYQVDEDLSEGDSSSSNQTQTVVLSDSQRNEFGLVQQINPPTYLGAIVLCQGADNPVVKLALVDAVSKITGLNANQISILKMD